MKISLYETSSDELFPQGSSAASKQDFAGRVGSQSCWGRAQEIIEAAVDTAFPNGENFDAQRSEMRERMLGQR